MKLFIYFARIGLFLFFIQSQAIFCASKIPDLSQEDMILENEGFLWKRSFVINDGEINRSICLEENHTELYGTLKKFQDKLSSIQENKIVELVKEVILDQDVTKSIMENFKSLNDDGRKIFDIMSEKEKSTENFTEEEKQKFIELAKRNFEEKQPNLPKEEGKEKEDEKYKKRIQHRSALGEEEQKAFDEREEIRKERQKKDQMKKKEKLIKEEALRLMRKKILEELFENEEIQNIIKVNLKRLKRRNFCIANINYLYGFNDSDPKTIPFYVPESEHKPVIFVSGIGNKLIRILEKTIFLDFNFIIFDDGIKKNIYKDNFNIYLDDFKIKLDNFYINMAPEDTSATSSLTRRYKTVSLKLSEASLNIENAKKEAEICIKEYCEGLDDEIKSLYEIPTKIINAKEAEKLALQNFISDFCDSEQAVRYFLFSNILTFLNDIPTTSNGLLIVNIHSLMDPCIYCTNSLHLECLLRNNGKYFSNEKGEKILLGFFQRLLIDRQENMPKVFIFVSSQRLESTGGMRRRLISGRNSPSSINEEIPINSDIRLFFRYNINHQES